MGEQHHPYRRSHGSGIIRAVTVGSVLPGRSTLVVPRWIPDNGLVLDVDLTQLGRAAHGVVLGVCVFGVLLASRPLLSKQAGQPIEWRRLSVLLAVIGLFGGAFRITPLGTDGRLAVAGLSLVVTVILTFAAVMPRAMLQRLRSGGPLRWMTAFALAAFPSMAVASDPLAAAGGAAGVAALVLVAGAVAEVFERREIERLVVVLAGAAVAVAASSMLLTPADAFWTIRSPGINERFVGWFPFVGLGWGHLGVGLLILGLERVRWRWPSFVSAAGLIVATQARGAAIAAVVVMIVWIALARRRWLPVVVAGLAALAVVALTVEPVRDLWDREQTIDEADSAFSYRVDYVRAAFRVAETSPVIGRGIDSGTVDEFSEELTVGRIGRVESTTMAWTTAVAGTGLLGTLALLATFASAWRWAVIQATSSSARWPVLVMTWVTVSSFFIVGPAELSAQAIVFALAILSVSAADGPALSQAGASSPAARRGFAASR